MRTHRLVAAVLLMGMGALGAPPAQADEGPSSSTTTTAATTTTKTTATSSSTSAGPTDTRSPAETAPTATPTRSPATGRGSATNPTSAPTASSTTSAPTAAAAADPSASIGAFDCGALSVVVTLDNTRSSTATTFLISLVTAPGPASSREEVVAAGATEEQRVELADDAYNEVYVSLSGGTLFASAGPEFCGAKPRVTIDAFDCSALQAQVTLDNQHGTKAFPFSVQWYWSNTDYDQSEPYQVAAGAVRVVTVPLVDNAWTTIWVREGFDLVPAPANQLVVTTRGLCGLQPGPVQVTVSEVNCAARTVEVIIDTRQTPPRRPRSTTFQITTSYGGKQDFVRYVEGEDVYRLAVPVKLRPRGRLTVIGAGPSGAAPREVLYSAPLNTACSAPTPSTPSTPAAPAVHPGQPGTPAAAEQLSATGGTPLPALFLAAGLVTSGVALIRLGTRRREH